MKRQRTMRPLAALTAAAGAAVLVAVGPLAGTAAAATQGDEEGNNELQIGYLCANVTPFPSEIGTLVGEDCLPENGAPFSGEINRTFYLADLTTDDLYVCRRGEAEVQDLVVGYDCVEAPDLIVPGF
jgi:hypothetical protein